VGDPDAEQLGVAAVTLSVVCGISSVSSVQQPADLHADAHNAQGILFAAVGAAAFSGKAIIVKLCYRYGVDAITVLMLRMLFALPLFLALSWWAGRGKAALSRGDFPLLFGLGFCGYYLASFLDFSGLQYVDASLERLVLYLHPTFVLALSALFFGVSVTRRQWVSLALSYLGVLLVFARDLSVSGAHVLLGSALVLGSAFSYAVYLVLSAAAIRRLGAVRITGVATSIACVLCTLQFFLLRPARAIMVPAGVIELSVLNAVLCTFLPVLMVMLAIERVGAPMVAQTGNIGPLATIFLSILVLGEPLTVWLAAGTVLVLSGIWLLASSSRTTFKQVRRR
jgi:drug/metabolite transporter (DMT)-like permease